LTDIRQSIDVVKEPWIGSPYYDDAEKWTFLFWEERFVFKQYFDKLDLTRCAELACGHGRHAEQLLQRYPDRVEALYCLDVLEENVAFTQTRIGMFSQARVILVSGADFQPITSDTLTSIFCYDAMVHFSPDIVLSYLVDAARVLVPGGRALLHHANLYAPDTGKPGRHYGLNPNARNHMTLALFEFFAQEAGLRILQTEAMAWGKFPDTDRITLLERPAN
jgi:SAM-dependent methyltransferase